VTFSVTVAALALKVAMQPTYVLDVVDVVKLCVPTVETTFSMKAMLSALL
jgi:hypothetical protein